MMESAITARASGALLLAVLVSVALCTSALKTCELGFPPGTTVLFVADPGTFSNTPESAVYLANLKENRRVPNGLSTCASVNLGKIMRSNVAVITTGIGPLSASLCVYDVLERCGPYIRDIFYSGTSGWSPQLGGVITNGTCESGKANTNNKLARLGDVCVSAYSVNWDCRQASWSETANKYPNQCNFPQQRNGPSSEFLFGQCQFTNVTSRELSLADEVLAAATAKSNLLPRRNNVIQKLEEDYWAAMSNGTRLTYPALPQTQPPKVWNYKECMEIDSQYFWSGAPWDIVSRQYVAETLNLATGSSSYTQTNVLAVSAMEAIGLSMAMERYNGLLSTRRNANGPIPYTYVRGNSDWVHSPLTYDPATKTWGQGPLIENFEQGYKYAISTASSVILSTLQVRCETGRYSIAGGAAVNTAAAAATKDNAGAAKAKPGTSTSAKGGAKADPKHFKPGPLYPCTFVTLYQ